jgi:hypothetical protein
LPAPAAQSAHLVGLLAVRGEHEHGHLAHLADALEHRPPVHLGQSHVKDDDIGALAVESAQPDAAVGGRGHREAAPFQQGPDAERDVRFVLDH